MPHIKHLVKKYRQNSIWKQVEYTFVLVSMVAVLSFTMSFIGNSVYDAKASQTQDIDIEVVDSEIQKLDSEINYNDFLKKIDIVTLQTKKDGKIVFGGSLLKDFESSEEVKFLDGQTGIVVLFDTQEKKIIKKIKIGRNIFYLDVNPKTNQIAVVGDFGLALLTKDGSEMVWHKEPAELGDFNIDKKSIKLSFYDNGDIALKIADKILIYSEEGGLIQTT